MLVLAAHGTALIYTGIAGSLAASITHPLDLTKVRLQTTGDKGMVQSMRRTVAAGGGSVVV
jgi:hypothetical protein